MHYNRGINLSHKPHSSQKEELFGHTLTGTTKLGVRLCNVNDIPWTQVGEAQCGSDACNFRTPNSSIGDTITSPNKVLIHVNPYVGHKGNAMMLLSWSCTRQCKTSQKTNVKWSVSHHALVEMHVCQCIRDCCNKEPAELYISTL